MAELKSIDVHNKEIEITLSISRNEYKALKHHTTDLLVLPCGGGMLLHHLTTGKLGNSNRIMLPKKVLAKFKINMLDKKVPSNIFILDDDAYLLIKLKKSELGVPKFKEEEHESNNRS